MVSMSPQDKAKYLSGTVNELLSLLSTCPFQSPLPICKLPYDTYPGFSLTLDFFNSVSESVLCLECPFLHLIPTEEGVCVGQHILGPSISMAL